MDFLNLTFYDSQLQSMQDQSNFLFYNNYTDNNNNQYQSSIISSISPFIKSSSSSNIPNSTDFSYIKNILLQAFIGIILYSLTIWTIIGNIFVWIALCTNKQLKQGGMSNYLIGNLALSDLLLGLTVLPFSATFSTLNNWIFGKFLCDIWLSIDVLCCTASIWGLLVIAIDRYIATNHPIVYRKQKNSLKTAIIYCTISWIVSLAISIPPFIHDIFSTTTDITVNNNNQSNSNEQQQNQNTKIISKNLKLINDNYYECVLYYKPSFVIASSMGSFYIPLILMILLYAKVFMRIRQQSKIKSNSANKKIGKKIKDLKMQQQSIQLQQTTKQLTKDGDYKNTAVYDYDQQTTVSLIDDKNKVKNSTAEVSLTDYEIETTVCNTNGDCNNHHYHEKSMSEKSCGRKLLHQVLNLHRIRRYKLETAFSSGDKNGCGKIIVKKKAQPSSSTHETTTYETSLKPQSSVNRHHNPSSHISRSEARITKTLAIIICCFILCWAPFFTAYIIRSQLNDGGTQISPLLMDIFIWLGYFNSSLNPILYAILNNNFRIAFKDILACKCFRKR